MDETNFVNAALGGYPHQSFVADRLGGVPTMIMPYIGALKSWLFAPIFSVFGVSVLTVRVPAIALSGGTLVVAYWAFRRVIGQWPSAVLVVVMATSASFALMSKVDWSPMVLAMLLKLVAFGCLFNLLMSRRLRWLWALLATLFLGVFNKQDFLWIVIGMAIGAVIVFPRQLVEIVRARALAASAPVAFFVMGLAAYGILVIRPNLGAGGSTQLQDPVTHFVLSWHLYVDTTMYSAVVGFFTGKSPGQNGWLQLVWIPTLGSVALLIARRFSGPLPSPARWPATAAAFSSVMAVVVFVEIAATKQATGPQHVIELWPLQAIIVLAATTALVRSAPDWRRIAVVVGSVALGTLLAAQAVATSQYVTLMLHANRLRAVFSVDVYRDARFLNEHIADVDAVVSAGWGPGTPLFSLACPGDRHKYRDDAWPRLVATNAGDAPSVVRAVFGNRRILLVSVHSPNDLPAALEANVASLEQWYERVYPANRVATALTTPAYDVTYFGPGRLGPATAPCAAAAGGG